MKVSNFEWDDLRYVLAVVRNKTFSEAARVLAVNQTTIARKIKSIEQRIGVKLFAVHKSGSQPTEVCLYLAEIAENISIQVAKAEARVLGKDGQLAGKIRVTAPDYILFNYPHLFQEFLQKYPEIKLEILASYGSFNINRREADIAIRVTNNPPDYLLGRKMSDLEFAVYGAKSFEGVTKEGFQDLPWIAWEESVPSSRVPNNIISELVPQSSIQVVVNNMSILQRLLEVGSGVTVLPTFIGDNLINVKKLSETREEPILGLWLLTHTELRNTARIRAFIEFFAQKFGACPALKGE